MCRPVLGPGGEGAPRVGPCPHQHHAAREFDHARLLDHGAGGPDFVEPARGGTAAEDGRAQMFGFHAEPIPPFAPGASAVVRKKTSALAVAVMPALGDGMPRIGRQQPAVRKLNQPVVVDHIVKAVPA